MKLNKRLKELLILILVLIVINLFFINKAVHIDDEAFISIARHMVNDPLHPYSFEYQTATSKTHFQTKDPVGSGGFYITDPPLIPLYYSFFIKFFSETEIILHLSNILLTLLAVVSMYHLSNRFTNYPFIATSFLIASPVFIIMSQGLMIDVQTLAFFICSIFLYIHGVDNKDYKITFISSIFITFAIFTKYTCLVLFPLLALYSILKRRYSFISPLLIPLIITFSWVYYTTAIYGASHLSFVTSYFYKNMGSVFQNIILLLFPYLLKSLNSIINIGAVIIFPFFLSYPFIKNKKHKIPFLFIILTSVIFSICLYIASSEFISGKYSYLQLLLFFVFLTSGIFALYLILNYLKKDFLSSLNMFKYLIIGKIKKREALKKLDQKTIDNIFLSAWFFGILAFNILIVSFAARHIILLVPVFIIFYINILESYKKNLKIDIKKISRIIFISTLSISTLMAINDYQLAGSYKTYADSLNYSQVDSIWYSGNHGFKYYLEKKGYKFLEQNSNSPKKGDIILCSVLQVPSKISPELEIRLKLIDEVKFKNGYPLRIFNIESHAGFYSYGAGFLPFSISMSDLDTIRIYKVIN